MKSLVGRTELDRPLNNARILIVDDDPLNQQILKSILQDEYNTFVVSSGAEAIEFCHRHLPDLVVMDVQMPDMDGWTACKIMQSSVNLRQTPVIFATSMDTADAEVSCWEAGGVDFLVKPVASVSLRNRVKTHLTLKFQSDTLKKLAYKDGLTHLYNRRYLEDSLPKERALARRNKSLLSVIMIDIDHFKHYNDTYGHLKGDACLKQVAMAINNVVLRPTDIVARYGGEEFICVLPNTDEQGAKVISRSILEAIDKIKIAHIDSSFGVVTVSMGLATTSNANEDSTELLAKADTNLYEAKSNGRNCWAA